MRALITAGFGALELRRIIAIAVPKTLASVRVLAKAGFRRVGIAHRYRYAKGQWWDIKQFALTDEEWNAKAVATAPRG